MPALAFALQLLGSLPMLIQAGADITGLVQHGQEKLTAMKNENRDPTDQEWQELNDRIRVLRDELHSGG